MKRLSGHDDGSKVSTFSCATSAENASKKSEDPPPILLARAMAVSPDYVEVWAELVGGGEARLEARNKSGEWLSIGDIKDGKFFNPAVPASYLTSLYYIRLRAVGIPGADFLYPVNQIITSVSSELNSDGSVYVTGTTTLSVGVLDAFVDGFWKEIATVNAGVFSNSAVPQSYLLDPDTLRVRVRLKDSVLTSDSLDSTLGFPHPRTVLIRPMMDRDEEAYLMSWQLQKADYQPTGYFVPAGAELKIWASGSVDDLRLHVGTNHIADWRDPSLSVNARKIALQHGENTIRDDKGGVIHICNRSKVGAARVVFSRGAIPIPYYVNGVTSAEQWVKMLNASKESQVHEVQLVGEHVVIGAFLKTALNFIDVDPADALVSHERVLSIQAEVAGLDGSKPEHTRSSLLIYALESYTGWGSFASYECIGMPHNPVVDSYSQALIGGQAANFWAASHAYAGHYQQRLQASPKVHFESISIYALAVGRVYRNQYTQTLPGRWSDTQKWLALPPEEKVFGGGPDPMAMFEQLRLGLGESFLPSLDRYGREHIVPSYDLGYYILSNSIVANYNLTVFFFMWGLLKESDTEIWDAVEDLGLSFPPVDLIKIRPYPEFVEGGVAEPLIPASREDWLSYGPKRDSAP